MSGVRTPTRQFSSCVLIECGGAWIPSTPPPGAIVKYVSQRAGCSASTPVVSLRAGQPESAAVKRYHTGCIPFYKRFQTAVKSCSQGGVRGGAATLLLPNVAPGSESLLVLKNNRGVEGHESQYVTWTTACKSTTDVHPPAER
ncbi:hypothetical protein ACNKHS_13605 [Shigella flexneri]